MGKDRAQGARTTAIDPLQPLIFVARGLAVLVLSLLALGVVATIFGSGSVLTIGDDPLCTTVSAGFELPRVSDSDAVSAEGLAPRVSLTDDQYQLCQERPDGSAQFLSLLTVLPETVLLLGFLAGVFLLVRRARQAGLFSRPLAQAVHRLGWYVLVGAVLVSIGQALAASALVRHLMPGHDLFDLTGYWDISVSTLLAGAGLLTIARVLRLTVAMQEDLDATI
jgi:hypothetical protein